MGRMCEDDFSIIITFNIISFPSSKFLKTQHTQYHEFFHFRKLTIDIFCYHIFYVTFNCIFLLYKIGEDDKSAEGGVIVECCF